MSALRRSYHSPRREAQAQRTRQRILAAARKLFVHDGFEGTSIAAIARRAKVAAPTVYAIFGTKRGVLTDLADQTSEEARRLAGIERVWELSDPREQIRQLARFQRIHGETGGDVLEMARSASAIDPDAAAVWREREEARRLRAGGLARAWDQRGLLRRGLDAAKAADIMWVLSDPSIYHLFVERCGWPGAQFERWLRDAFEAQVLA